VIVGVGTDLVRIDRIAAAQSRWGQRFVERVLGHQERHEYAARGPAPGAPCIRGQAGWAAICYLAKRFAAKEAFGKALGLGLRAPMALGALEILAGPHGRPQAVPNGALAAWLATRRWIAHVSLSDEIDHALALVIIEQV
jgi:holo-[acyl-carrier protein] synthase